MYHFSKMAVVTPDGGKPSKGRMAPRLALSLMVLLALADLPCAAQFGSPYPGVGGGIGFPGGGVGFPGGGGGYPGSGRNRNGPAHRDTPGLTTRRGTIAAAGGQTGVPAGLPCLPDCRACPTA